MYAGKSFKAGAHAKKTVIKTTFLDLIAKLVETTNDNAVILGSVKHIMDHCNVRLVRSLAPVRLTSGESGLQPKSPMAGGQNRAIVRMTLKRLGLL